MSTRRDKQRTETSSRPRRAFVRISRRMPRGVLETRRREMPSLRRPTSSRTPRAPIRTRNDSDERRGGIYIGNSHPRPRHPPSKSVYRGGGEPGAGDGFGAVRSIDKEELTSEVDKFIPRLMRISLLSFDDMDKMSEVDVHNPSGKGPGSVEDPLLGPSNPLLRCDQCREQNCPGHYGLIRFPEKFPIPNPMIVDTIGRVLSCVCNDCSHLMIDRKILEERGYLKIPGPERLRKICEDFKDSRCHTRRRGETGEMMIEGVEMGEIKKCVENPIFAPAPSMSNGWVAYKLRGQGSETHRMDPKQVFDILDDISDEDASLLGFDVRHSHPRDMVLRGIPVLPINVRPPVVQGSEIGCDQLTMIYNNIVQHNQKLKSKIDAEEMGDVKGAFGQNAEYLNMLNAVIDLMTGNKTKTFASRPAMPINSRLQGKEGLLRRYMMGKRGNYCGRTVFGPDTSLKFGQIRIPEVMASRFTIPVRIFDVNKRAVEEMIRQGKIVSIEDERTGTHKTIEPGMAPPPLRVGQIAERKLQNGDMIVVNRQPSLHMYSMMAFEVVLGKQLTIGLHLSTTIPFNADFDGDEGNTWHLRSFGSRAEAEEFMNVKECIISAQTNKPIIALVMDSVTSLFLLTRNADRILEKDTFFDLLSVITNQDGLPTLEERAIRYGVHPRSGRALFSAILPPDFYYRKGAVEIIEGILTRSSIHKGHTGTSDRSIVQELQHEYGKQRTSDFLTDGSFIATAFLDYHGFSVGIQDCAPENPELEAATQKYIADSKNKIASIMGSEPRSVLEEEYQEKEIVGVLNQLKALTGKKTGELYSADNAVRIMAKEIGGGAKGDTMNVTQMKSALFQQHIFGGRPKLQITGGTRALCTFEEGSKDLEAHGCVFQSFSEGLTPDSFYFHQSSARQGLVDTSVKTAETGKLQHDMVKAFEELISHYDGSVRDNVGTIIQFAYGNDGFDGSWLLNVPTGTQKEMATFVDVKMLAARHNVKRGWIPGKSQKYILRQQRKLLREM